MPKNYYAVARGRETGVYDSWDACKSQTNGVSNASFKKFSSAAEAQAFVSSGGHSSAPSSGYSGGGYSSGYSYGGSSGSAYSSSSSSSKFNVDSRGYTNVYTDGACTNNGRTGAKAGAGAYFGRDNPLNVSEPVHGRQTNNVAEIEAARMAAEQAARAGVPKLKINTDSEFMYRSMNEWVPKWKANGWKTADGRDVINRPEFERLERSLAPFQDVQWEKVPAHSGVHGNEEADRLANEGARRH